MCRAQLVQICLIGLKSAVMIYTKHHLDSNKILEEKAR